MENYNNNEALYRYFKKTILAESAKEVEALTKDIETLKNEAKKIYTEQLEKQAQVIVLKETEVLESAHHARLSVQENKRHQALMTKRSILIESLFKKLSNKIISYAKTTAYKNELIDKIKTLNLTEYPTIYSNAQDALLLKDMINVLVDDTIIAGFKAVNKNKKSIIDETYNEKISKAKEYFFDHASWFI